MATYTEQQVKKIAIQAYDKGRLNPDPRRWTKAREAFRFAYSEIRAETGCSVVVLENSFIKQLLSLCRFLHEPHLCTDLAGQTDPLWGYYLRWLEQGESCLTMGCDLSIVKTLMKYNLAALGVGGGYVHPDSFYVDPQDLVTEQTPNPAPIKVASTLAGDYNSVRLTIADLIEKIRANLCDTGHPITDSLKKMAESSVDDLLKHLIATVSDGQVYPPSHYTTPTAQNPTPQAVPSVFIKDGIDLGTGLADASLADMVSDATYNSILPQLPSTTITTGQLHANKLENIDKALRWIVAELSDHGVVSANLEEGAHVTVPAGLPFGGQPVRDTDGNLIPYTWVPDPITQEPLSNIPSFIPGQSLLPGTYFANIIASLLIPQTKATSTFLYKRLKAGARDETIASILIESLRAGVKEPTYLERVIFGKGGGGSYGKGLADMLATTQVIDEDGFLDNIFTELQLPEGVGALLERALTLKDNGLDSKTLEMTHEQMKECICALKTVIEAVEKNISDPAEPIPLNLKLIKEALEAIEPTVTVEVPQQPAPQITVEVPQQPAPQITVEVPQQPAPQITVEVPQQPAPQITVEVPQQPAPTVTVNVPTPTVTVNNEVQCPEVNVTNQVNPADVTVNCNQDDDPCGEITLKQLLDYNNNALIPDWIEDWTPFRSYLTAIYNSIPDIQIPPNSGNYLRDCIRIKDPIDFLSKATNEPWKAIKDNIQTAAAVAGTAADIAGTEAAIVQTALKSLELIKEGAELSVDTVSDTVETVGGVVDLVKSLGIPVSPLDAINLTKALTTMGNVANLAKSLSSLIPGVGETVAPTVLINTTGIELKLEQLKQATAVSGIVENLSNLVQASINLGNTENDHLQNIIIQLTKLADKDCTVDFTDLIAKLEEGIATGVTESNGHDAKLEAISVALQALVDKESLAPQITVIVPQNQNADVVAAINKLVDATLTCCCNGPLPDAPPPDAPRAPQPTTPEPVDPTDPGSAYVDPPTPVNPNGVEYGERRADAYRCKAIKFIIGQIISFLQNYVQMMEVLISIVEIRGVPAAVNYLLELKWVKAFIVIITGVAIADPSPAEEIVIGVGGGTVAVAIFLAWLISRTIETTIDKLWEIIDWIKDKEDELICILYNATSTDEAHNRVLDFFNQTFAGVTDAAASVISLMFNEQTLNFIYWATGTTDVSAVVATCDCNCEKRIFKYAGPWPDTNTKKYVKFKCKVDPTADDVIDADCSNSTANTNAKFSSGEVITETINGEQVKFGIVVIEYNDVSNKFTIGIKSITLSYSS